MNTGHYDLKFFTWQKHNNMAETFLNFSSCSMKSVDLATVEK